MNESRKPASWGVHLVLLGLLAVVGGAGIVADQSSRGGLLQGVFTLFFIAFFIAYALITSLFVALFAGAWPRAVFAHLMTWGLAWGGYSLYYGIPLSAWFAPKVDKRERRLQRSKQVVELVSWQAGYDGDMGPGWNRITVQAHEPGPVRIHLVTGMSGSDQVVLEADEVKRAISAPVHLEPGQRHTWEVQLERRIPGAPSWYFMRLSHGDDSDWSVNYMADVAKGTSWRDGVRTGLELPFEMAFDP